MSKTKFLGIIGPDAYGGRGMPILISNRRKAKAAFNKGQIVAMETEVTDFLGILDPKMDSASWNGLQGRFYRFPSLDAMEHAKAIQIAS